MKSRVCSLVLVWRISVLASWVMRLMILSAVGVVVVGIGVSFRCWWRGVVAVPVVFIVAWGESVFCMVWCGGGGLVGVLAGCLVLPPLFCLPPLCRVVVHGWWFWCGLAAGLWLCVGVGCCVCVGCCIAGERPDRRTAPNGPWWVSLPTSAVSTP